MVNKQQATVFFAAAANNRATVARRCVICTAATCTRMYKNAAAITSSIFNPCIPTVIWRLRKVSPSQSAEFIVKVYRTGAGASDRPVRLIKRSSSRPVWSECQEVQQGPTGVVTGELHLESCGSRSNFVRLGSLFYLAHGNCRGYSIDLSVQQQKAGRFVSLL